MGFNQHRHGRIYRHGDAENGENTKRVDPYFLQNQHHRRFSVTIGRHSTTSQYMMREKINSIQQDVRDQRQYDHNIGYTEIYQSAV